MTRRLALCFLAAAAAFAPLNAQTKTPPAELELKQAIFRAILEETEAGNPYATYEAGNIIYLHGGFVFNIPISEHGNTPIHPDFAKSQDDRRLRATYFAQMAFDGGYDPAADLLKRIKKDDTAAMPAPASPLGPEALNQAKLQFAKKIYETLKELAQKGNPYAAKHLARWLGYERQNVFTRSEIPEASAPKIHPDLAQPKDTRKKAARTLYLFAAKAGVNGAWTSAAETYDDPKEELACLREGAAFGDAESARELIEKLQRQEAPDYAEIARLTQMIIDAPPYVVGNVIDARMNSDTYTFRMGFIYFWGRGVPRDPGKAVALWRSVFEINYEKEDFFRMSEGYPHAASFGDLWIRSNRAEAAACLAYAIENGLGTPKNAQAAQLLREGIVSQLGVKYQAESIARHFADKEHAEDWVIRSGMSVDAPKEHAYWLAVAKKLPDSPDRARQKDRVPIVLRMMEDLAEAYAGGDSFYEKEAFYWTQRLANIDRPGTRFDKGLYVIRLAGRLLSGNGTVKNAGKACDLLNEMYLHGGYDIGYTVGWDPKTKKSPPEGSQEEKTTLRRRRALVAAALAYCLENGLGTPKDTEKANEIRQRAKSELRTQNDAEALAAYFAPGGDIVVDAKQFAFWKQAAKNLPAD